MPLPISLRISSVPAEGPHPRHGHVHADAAAGDAAHRLGRAEARPRDQPQQVVVAGQVGRRVRLPLAPRLGQDRRAVDAAAVVAHPERDAVAVPGRREQDAPLGRLARGDAGLGGLDPVVGGVPDQVQERIADLVQDRAVELDLLAFDVEPDPLAEVPRQIAHQPGKPLEHLADRGHPRRDHLRLHARHQPRDPVAELGERGIVRAGGHHAQPVLGDDQLAHLLHQPVEPREVDADLPVALHPVAQRRGGLLEAHRVDLAGAPDRRGQGLLAGRRLDPEAEPAVELLALELDQRRADRRHHTQHLGPTNREDGARPPHHGLGLDGHLDRRGRAGRRSSGAAEESALPRSGPPPGPRSLRWRPRAPRRAPGPAPLRARRPPPRPRGRARPPRGTAARRFPASAVSRPCRSASSRLSIR